MKMLSSIIVTCAIALTPTLADGTVSPGYRTARKKAESGTTVLLFVGVEPTVDAPNVYQCPPIDGFQPGVYVCYRGKTGPEFCEIRAPRMAALGCADGVCPQRIVR